MLIPRKPLILLAGMLASCAPFGKSKPTATRTPVRRVVLVHGFLETGSTFALLQDRLENQGVKCLVPKLSPMDGRGGLEKLAKGLKRDIDAAFGPDETISVVGFSMGGIVSRYYLQNLGGAKRCETFITVASPHHGTRSAWLYPSQGAEEMRPGSRFLRDLEQSESNLGDMKVISYRTRLDLIILPSSSSIWERAENIEHPSLLHPLLLLSPKVIKDIERRILQE
jgi:triacylglycerol lipase